MLQTADDTTQRIADTWNNPRAGDAGLIVRFAIADIEDMEATKAAGYPVYKQVESVTIRAPGATDSRFYDLTKEKARLYYANRFPRQYADFKHGLEEPTHGTPLKEWPPLRRLEAEELQSKGLRTVEELAGVLDHNLGILGNRGRGLRQKAIDWLENAKSGASVAKVKAELAERDSKIEVLMRAVETLQKQNGLPTQPIVEAPAHEAAPEPVKRTRKPRSPKEA